MKTYKLLTTLCLLLLIASLTNAQDPSAILDLESTSQGVLAPRMTSAERTAIVSPAEGLLVYDTDSKSFWFYEGVAWGEIGAGTSSVDELSDADGDTKVEVERSADDDVIRLSVAGSDKLDIGATTAILRSGLELGGSSGIGPFQLNLGGSVNSGVNHGSPTGTYKLRITGYNNDDGDVVYPIYSLDENANVDFFIKNRDLVGGEPTIGYFGGSVGIGVTTPETKLQVVGANDLSLSANSGFMVLGSTTGLNVGFDNNEIMARNNGTASTLFMQIEGGSVNIGSTASAAGYKLNVDGKIACEEMLIDLSGDWPDYVFESDYELKSLDQVKKHIDEKGHLPGVPSAKEIEENGIVVGEINKVLMEKIEELTLYILQQEERLRALENSK